MPHSHHRWRTTPAKHLQARMFRRSTTPAEAVLWQQLRGRQVLGLKFRRQHPLHGFIVDFCCLEQRIIIELDGDIHQDSEQAAYDKERDQALAAAGFRILRIPNEHVLSNIDAVLAAIRQ